jgi:hypothetical protein
MTMRDFLIPGRFEQFVGLYDANVAMATCAPTVCGWPCPCVGASQESAEYYQEFFDHMSRMEPTYFEAGIPSSGHTIPLKLTEWMNGPHRKHLMITDRDKGMAPKGKPNKAHCFCLCLLHSFLEHDPKVGT